MRGGKKSGAVRRYGNICSLYLVNPKNGGMASSMAEKLIKISGVEEVFVTEGDYGFVVKAKHNTDNKKIYSAIQNHAKGDLRFLTTYYRYKK